MEPNREMLADIFKMVKENNHMLHSMRRRALIGGLLKFVIWTILFVAPIWFYMTYLNASVQNMLHTVDQVRSTGNQAQTQLNSFADSLKELESKLPAFMQGSTTKAK
jgi:hypothetical protein